jgi:hypothetical protein
MSKEVAIKALEEALANLEEALAKQVQCEPYGYVDVKGGGIFIYGEHQFQNTKNVELVPVYTTPQRTWVGLTDEDKASCVQATAKRGSTYELIAAIEAKLKEKNT